MRWLAALLIVGCGSSPQDPAPLDLASPPSALIGDWVCEEPEGYGWVTVSRYLLLTYDGLAGPHPRWCRKFGQLTIISEQPSHVTATFHHYAPAEEPDYTIDATIALPASTWRFTANGVDVFPPNTCTRCPSSACEAHALAPWPFNVPLGNINVCDPTLARQDGGTQDLAGVPPTGDAWDRPLDGIQPHD